MDTTGADSLRNLVDACRERGVRLIAAGFMAQPLEMARRTGLLAQVQADLQPDVTSAIAAAIAALPEAGAPPPRPA
jgi:SulP family sulfate permease